MSLDKDFEMAVAEIKSFSQRPIDDELLELYALFKQSSDGDVISERPGIFDLKAKAKWDRWNSKKGMSKDEAKKLYIAYVTELRPKYK